MDIGLILFIVFAVLMFVGFGVSMMCCFSDSSTSTGVYVPMQSPAGSPGMPLAGAPQQGWVQPVPPATAQPSALARTYDFFISNTERSGQATTLASDLAGSLKEAGMRVWNSANEGDKDAEEKIRGSANFIAVISGPCSNADFPDDPPELNAYFSRHACLDELAMAVAHGVPIQPVIRATDKREIGAMISLAPEELKFIGGIDFITMDRSDADYWQVGVEKVLRARKESTQSPAAITPQQTLTSPAVQAHQLQAYPQTAYPQPGYGQVAYAHPPYGQPQYGQQPGNLPQGGHGYIP